MKTPTPDEQLTRLREQLRTVAGNIARNGESDPLYTSGLMLVAERTIDELSDQVAAVRTATAREVAKASAAFGPDDDGAPLLTPKHRHKFSNPAHPDGVPTCTVQGCGHSKSVGGRPKANPGAASTKDPAFNGKSDPPSAPLPLGDAAADKFSGGNHGSSGVRRA